MGYWGAIAAAALLWALAGIAQHRALETIAHEAVELAPGTPATVYWPPAEVRAAAARPAGQGLPTVVLAHGWGSNRGSLRTLARGLAAAGYAAIAVDLDGHGASGRGFPAASNSVPALLADIDAAVLYARGHAEFDGERLALLGHGLGGDLALEYASRSPALAAVIALSPVRSWSGGYSPPNPLLIWGEDQRLRSPAVARELGERLVGTQQIRVGRSYGSFERGSAVRTVELEGGGYYGLLFSDTALAEIRDWLASALGPHPAPSGAPGGPGGEAGRATPPPAQPAAAAPPGLLGWSLLGFGASAALFWLVCGLAAPAAAAPTPAADAPLRGLLRFLVVLPAALFLAGAGDRSELSGPFDFFPFAGAAPLLGALIALGAGLSAAAAREGRWQGPSAFSLLAAAGFAALLYLAAGSALAPIFDPWLGTGRAGWALAAAALALPYCTLSEQLLRGRGAAVLLPGLAKLLLLGGLVAASLLGWLASDWLLLLPGLAVLLLGLELAALALQRIAAGPWLAGALQALGLGWFLTAAFPYRF